MTRRFIVLCAAASLALAACGGSGLGNTVHEATCSPSGTSLRISADHLHYSIDCLAAPANQPFTIAFDNKDSGVAHNVRIYTTSGRTLFNGSITTGSKAIDYHVSTLAPGTYRFHCDVHPDSMQGTFIVK